MNKKNFRIFCNVLRHTKADKVLLSYIVFVFADAALIWVLEPTFHTYREALWYCYAVLSTAGFGDIVVTAFIPKLLSVALTVYSLAAIAILTAVVVNFYTQMIEMKNKETIIAFLDRLERLPELSESELKELSERVVKFRRSGKEKKK